MPVAESLGRFGFFIPRLGFVSPSPHPPGLCWDGWGTAQPFAETLPLLLLNKPPAGSSADVRVWKYLCEDLEPARRSPQR